MIRYALLDPAAGPDDVDEFVKAILGDEARHKGGPGHDQDDHGKWAHGIVKPIDDVTKPSKKTGVFQTDDPTRTANLPAEYRAQMDAVIDKHFPGLTQEKMEANIQTELDRALADPAIAARKDWYADAHDQATGLGKKYDYDDRAAIGAVAALSPQQAWGSNVAAADATMRYLRENPTVRLSPAEYELAAKQLAKRGKAMPDLRDGARLNDFDDPYVKAALIKGMSKDAGLQGVDDITGKPAGISWSCGLNGQAKAIMILEGGDPDRLLTGHKVRSFNNDITAPHGKHGSVTIDTHALSAAAGTKVPAGDKRQAVLTTPSNIDFGSAGSYAVFADAYRNVAARNGLLPQQAQALVWLQWRKENPR